MSRKWNRKFGDIFNAGKRGPNEYPWSKPRGQSEMQECSTEI